ncbi:magnesium transporter protein 1-like [Watersipora subatra]|uniref:magnesium transporter protein 1-like n=1 Tax=Watersipora subatra TaxID=2589382 RepID=UPI00355AD91F
MLGRIFYISVAISTCCILTIGTESSISQLNKKVETLNELSMRRPVIRLDSEKFKLLVRTPPRSYSVFVMFTALKSQRGCTVCRQASEEFQVLANSYWTSPEATPSVYFAMVDYDDASEAFQSMKLSTAPVFIHFPAKGKPKKGDTFEVHRHGFDAEVLQRFITERTGLQFKIRRPPNYLMNIVVLLSIGLLGALVYIKRDSMDFLFQKTTWACIVISFILVMMSGQMWNQIRGAGFAHRDPRTGEVSYIHGSSQGQFVAETYIVMALHGSIAIGFILINEANSQKGIEEATRKVYAGLGFAMVVGFFSLILAIFRSKYQGYPYRFLL